MRGFLTRKKMNEFRAGTGIGHHQIYNLDGQILQNYDNPKVLEIRGELGDFDFESGAPQTASMEVLEFKGMMEQPNHARYEGEW